MESWKARATRCGAWRPWVRGVWASGAAIIGLLAVPAVAGAGNRLPVPARAPVPRFPAVAVRMHPRSRSSVPSPSNNTSLNAVSCVSVSDCWAVGWFENEAAGEVNEALHWNGKKWARVATPNPAGRAAGDSNMLFGAGCASASDCWAVGYTTHASGGDLNEALHWNGKKWSAVHTPQPGGTTSPDENRLFGVTCSARSNCWATGQRSKAAGGLLDQALRWNGKRWLQVLTPNPAGTGRLDSNQLNHVSCTSVSSCWAVGYALTPSKTRNQALRWNGKRWSSVSTPNAGRHTAGADNDLLGVTCTSRSDCTAVGYGAPSDSQPPQNVGLRWNGAKWSKTAPYQPGIVNELSGVSCGAASNCWAVGIRSKYNEADLNSVLWWNGHTWAGFATPEPGGTRDHDDNVLYGVSCVSPTDCWAVGIAANFSRRTVLNEALHWNGRKWSSR
jgi:hypothetical protein